jgi:acetyl esterase/lipase
MKRRILFLLVLLQTLAGMAQREVYRSTSPGFTVAIPEQGADGRAVVLCPGGGYNHIAKSKEGADWIPFFTSQGIAVIVTKYTLPDGDRERPLGDIRNTFKMVREHAAEWGINPNGIGIMGFSAGGHLASAYTNSETGDLKPAFTILFYPVIRMDNKEHQGMAKKFLGNQATDEQRKAWSTNRMVNEDTPKTIIITADDDPTIDPINSTMYYEALKRNHVEATLHIYSKGGHGFGFAKSFPYHERMKADLSDWLQTLAIPAVGAKKVACIGNSITFGARLKFRHEESYPVQLQQLLGDGYWVKNFGVSGSTMTAGANHYMGKERYQHALQFNPDIVIIKLGTNDVQPRYWKNAQAYTEAYQRMIDELKALPSHPRIILCLPATSYRNEKIVDEDITQKVIPLIEQVAKKNKLPVIDLHTPTAGHAELFPDQLHPNKEGAAIIAHTIVDYLKK